MTDNNFFTFSLLPVICGLFKALAIADKVPAIAGAPKAKDCKTKSKDCAPQSLDCDTKS
jgi:hypothetical protein